MIWTALQRYATIFIQFVSGIILARLLTPHDYGCIGMLTIFMVLSRTFIDSGFGSALIQKKQPTQVDYSSIFWWNIGMAIVMYSLLFVSAPAIARFYRIPLLSKVLRVQGVVLFIYAFNIIQQNMLRKNLNFKLLSIVTIVTSVVALSVTIWMAYAGFGVWALVAQYIITAAVPAAVFWFTVKWRPSFVFSTQSFKKLFGFGFYMFMTQFISELSRQIQGLLIGKVYNPSTLGYYTRANSTEQVASTSISQIVTQVAYPLYAEVQDDKKRLANMIQQLTAVMAYINAPLMFILLLCAKPLFQILYSEKWLPSVPYFQILCIAGLAYSLQSVNTQSIAAIGKSDVMFRWTIVKRIIGLFFVVGGLALFGIYGLLWGAVLNTWFCYSVNIGLVSKYIGYKWFNQVLNLIPIMALSSVTALVCYLLGKHLQLTMHTELVLIVLFYSVLYIITSAALKMQSYQYTKSALMQLLSKARKKTR